MKTKLIINPRAANGKTRRIWPVLKSILAQKWPGAFDAEFTEYPGHATRLTHTALTQGYACILSVGGDGTLNEVLNGFFENGTDRPLPGVLGVIEIGTGCDFARTIGMPTDPRAAVDYLIQAQPVPTDVGRARFQTLSGEESVRYFINILDFGIGGAVVERVNRTSKALGARITFLYGILATLATYTNKTIEYRLDEADWKQARLNNFIVANGRHFGGGLTPAPMARIDDGCFEIVLFGDIGRWQAVTNLSRLRKGTHLENPLVTTAQARTVVARSAEEVFIDMDGELVGKLPVTVEILPAVLPVLRQA
ncbi:MAG: diacylglycerol kinase family lipid kinase [Calditrichaeota bacterium]|nr:diacylglycerol kinase family lipid kinase [Calditrichota bacterium]